jgi:integrase
MTRKNSNGAGSIYKDKTSERWVGAITIGLNDAGRPIRRKVTGKTQDDVRDRLERLRRSTELDATLPADITTGNFLDYWLTEVLPGTDISQITRDGYERMVRLYLKPTIGKVRLDKLEPHHVRRMMAKLQDQPVKVAKGQPPRTISPNTIRQARSVLRRALRTAMADGLVTRNVAQIVDGVRVGRSTATH